MRIRSLRMQENEGMTSESSPLPSRRSFAQLFALRPSDLEGNTLTQPSPVTSSSHPQMLSETTIPAHMLREVGSHPISATSASSSTGSTPMPPHSCALVLASSNTTPNTASARDEDRPPLAARQHILDDLADCLHCLSISERSHVLQSLPTPSAPPQ